MPDEKDLHDPNNPIYSQEKSWHEKQLEEKAISDARKDEEMIWAGSPTSIEEGEPIISPEFYKRGEGIRAALNDTTEPTYKESNLTIKVLEDLLTSNPNFGESDIEGAKKYIAENQHLIQSKNNETKK